MKDLEFYRDLLEVLTNTCNKMNEKVHPSNFLSIEEREFYMHLTFAHFKLLNLYNIKFTKDVLQIKNKKRHK